MSKRITFALPGRGRGGGTKVTVEMANRLLQRGYDVRIAYQKSPPLYKRAGLKEAAREVYMNARGVPWDFIQDFKGPAESFTSLNDLKFEKQEVVIAVTILMTRDVYEIQQDVIKVRYAHEGLVGFRPLVLRDAWSILMQTIVVSEPLVSIIETATREKVLGVVPNGIDFTEFYEEKLQRDGIGTIYSLIGRKAPDYTIWIMEAARKLWPDIPQYIFSKDKRPQNLRKDIFWRHPSIAMAREFYNRSKVWVLASRAEGFGLPILEAMACGCAVVSSDHDTVSGLIKHGENGLLYPVGDSFTALQHVELLLNNESLRQKIVEHGFETVKRFGWDNAVEKMEECLEKLQAEYYARKKRG